MIEGSNSRIIPIDVHFSKAEPIAIAIYIHGQNGFKDWGNFNRIANIFNQSDIHLIKFNFSHNGTTLEQPQNFADLEAFGNDNYSKQLYDIQQVLNWVQQQAFYFSGGPKNKLPVFLIGHSKGGGVATLVTSQNPWVSGLITWAAIAYLTTPWRRLSAEQLKEWKQNGVFYLENKRTKQQLPVYYQAYEDYLANKELFDLSNAAQKINQPWLIIHGDADEAVPLSDAESLNNWGKTSQLKVIPGAGHTFGRVHPEKEETLTTEAQELVLSTIEFIKKALKN